MLPVYFSILFYVVVFLYSIVIGSFLNVCILRIPLKQTVVSKRSHCMKCGHTLAWYDLFPLFSYLFLKGKCRYCKQKISAQYPIVEGANGILAVLCFLIAGFFPHTIQQFNEWIYLGGDFEVWDWAHRVYDIGNLFFKCFVCSALIVITVVDWRTFEIPVGANRFILILGVIKLIATVMVDSRYYKMYCDDIGVEPSFIQLLNGNGKWIEYVLGFFMVSFVLWLIYVLSKGRAIGGGDVKLMAVAGLFLGWKLNLVALIAGCLYGSVIHIIRMKISGEGKQLAMGPYLSAGIVTAMWFGNSIITWYSGFFN